MGALKGKTALVTGASRGIGRGTAVRLAREGALVAVHYRSNQAAAEETIALIEKEGGRAFPLAAELGKSGDVETLYDQFDAELAKFGGRSGLDILVNNAAISISADIHAVSPENFDRQIAVNIKAPLFLIQQGLLRLRDSGRIINISSAATRIAFPENVVYALAKGALETLTLALAKELGPRGITVNAVTPGFIATDLNARRRTTPEAVAELAAYSVFGRVGEVVDVADIVAFLASDQSRWITGQRIDASGGTRL